MTASWSTGWTTRFKPPNVEILHAALPLTHACLPSGVEWQCGSAWRSLVEMTGNRKERHRAMGSHEWRGLYATDFTAGRARSRRVVTWWARWSATVCILALQCERFITALLEAARVSQPLGTIIDLQPKLHRIRLRVEQRLFPKAAITAGFATHHEVP